MVTTTWLIGQFGYDYDTANRLTGLSLPIAITSSYTYDDAGRLTLLAHNMITQTLASYAYKLDKVGNRTTLTETLVTVPNLISGTYLESGGQAVMEAEKGQTVGGTTHTWLTMTTQSGYTGTAYLQARPDLDALYSTGAITGSPKASYILYVTTPGTYTVWLRGYPTNAAGDSVQVGLGTQLVDVTGFGPGMWGWANKRTAGGAPATLVVTTTGLYTLSLWMREDGLRLDRLLLTTNAGFTPTSFGPAESGRYGYGASAPTVPLTRTLVYTYDNLYRLITATYTTGESYAYEYDPVGNRLKQIINGNTTSYLYDAANRLSQVAGQSYTFDNNGNLKLTGAMTNTFDAANRLISSTRNGVTAQPIYNGVGDRVGQTVGTTTTHFALDVEGLPEVIYTSSGEIYLHLPGVIVTKKGSEVRYLLSDGLGSIRQAVDENRAVVAYNEFDPYGNPVQNDNEPYGFTGEWWDSYIKLLHLRARWYLAETATFLSKDPWQGDDVRSITRNGWEYGLGNPINYVDPSGYCAGPAFVSGGAGVMELMTPDDCLGGGGGSGGLVIGLGIVIAAIIADEVIDTAVEEMIDIANEAWDNWTEPEPEPTPIPLPIPTDTIPYPQATCTPDDDDRGYRVLTLGDGNFSYSYSLHVQHRDWTIMGTEYGNGSNSQTRIPGGIGNLKLYTNVDATRLESGPVTGHNQYDAIVFNAPRAITGWRQEAGDLVDDVLRSARHVLKPGGHIRFSSTRGMPAGLRLIQRTTPGEWPPGYSNAYRGGLYLDDPQFGVPYHPLKNEGTPLKFDWDQFYWWTFVK